MTELDPHFIFDLISHDVPKALHPHLLVVGSLAAAQHHRDRLRRQAVNTKDADIVIQPAGAVAECVAIARQLRAAGWRQVPDERFSPQKSARDVPKMPVVRLRPPDADHYFIELLGFPDTSQAEAKRNTPIELDDGWYCLPSFRFMGLARVDPQRARNGLAYAAPSMMALANLLSHPTLGTDRMQGRIEGRRLLRSAKDLGRVLTLARLAPDGEALGWAAAWSTALRTCFPADHRLLARRVGDGLRELLGDVEALDEATLLVNDGLLAGYNVTADNLRALGRQVLRDEVDELQRLAAAG